MYKALEVYSKHVVTNTILAEYSDNTISPMLFLEITQ